MIPYNKELFDDLKVHTDQYIKSMASKNYVIAVDPADEDFKDSLSSGYVYVADITKDPMVILETYKVTKDGLKRIENDRKTSS